MKKMISEQTEKTYSIREISKMFEESVRGTLAEIAAHFTTVEPKGEIVIVVAGKNDKDIKNKNTEK